ncbi:MAG: hypothetical protein ACLQUY_14970 [Ktedonobacterales bacterium]
MWPAFPQAELTELINEKIDGFTADYGGGVLRRILITPHQEKLLKLKLAETFEFRWKSLKHKYLDRIDGTPVVLADKDAHVCSECGSIHDQDQPW